MPIAERSLIINAKVPGYQGLQQILVEAGTIAKVEPMVTCETSLPALDMAGDWLSLGGMDLQINGALGLAFPELTPAHHDKLTKICDWLWQQGVDQFVPTLVTSSVAAIQQSLATLAEFLPHPMIAGVHLEGPFLNPAKRGAHPAEHLQPLTIERVQQVLGDYAPLVQIMTLAPELDDTQTVIPYLRERGITVSLGHSLATAAQAQQAFAQGATMVTHAFNAMPPLHHREPGLLAAAIAHPQVYCGLIADGVHVAPLMVDVLLRASHYAQGVFLVSDALAPLGLPDGIYPWDSREIEVRAGTARLPDGTLSGTTLPLLTGAENLVKWDLCDPETAIKLVTVAPRQAMGRSSDVQGTAVISLLRWHFKENKMVWQRIVDNRNSFSNKC